MGWMTDDDDCGEGNNQGDPGRWPQAGEGRVSTHPASPFPHLLFSEQPL